MRSRLRSRAGVVASVVVVGLAASASGFSLARTDSGGPLTAYHSRPLHVFTSPVPVPQSVRVPEEHEPEKAVLPVGPQRALSQPIVIDPQQLFPPSQKRTRRLAAPPLKIVRNVDVYSTTGSSLEPSIANSGPIVLYTGNFRVSGFSTDHGSTFTPIDQLKIFGTINQQAPCCDQVVQYVPWIDRFVWVNMYKTPGNPLRIAEISPDDLVSGGGVKGWKVWTLNVSDFPKVPKGDSFDYPDLEYGRGFLYLTVNVGGNLSVIARASLKSVQTGAAGLIADYYYASDTQLVRVAQVPQNRQRRTVFFAGFPNTTSLRVFRWDESSTSPTAAPDVPIKPIDMDFHWPTPDKPVLPPPKGCPYSNDLYGCGNAKFDWRITGATLSGSSLWFAWSEGGDPTANTALRTPHISILLVDSNTFKPVREEYFADATYANGHPTLATNGGGDVGITWGWGGGAKDWGNQAVGFIDPPPAATGVFAYTGFGTAGGIPGHYISIRELYPESVGNLLAIDYVQLKDQNHPHVVIFRRGA